MITDTGKVTSEFAKAVSQSFQLHPFASDKMATDLSIDGAVARSGSVLLVEFRLKGMLDTVRRPANMQKAERCHELWKETCFELFIAVQDEPGYWEVNLSCNQCWNVYRFNGYRLAMREEERVGPPSVGVYQADGPGKTGPLCPVTKATGDFSPNLPGQLDIRCRLDLSGLVAEYSDLQLGVASVVQGKDGHYSYWALQHNEKKPDFHKRSSFSLVLPGTWPITSNGEVFK